DIVLFHQAGRLIHIVLGRHRGNLGGHDVSQLSHCRVPSFSGVRLLRPGKLHSFRSRTVFVKSPGACPHTGCRRFPEKRKTRPAATSLAAFSAPPSTTGRFSPFFAG